MDVPLLASVVERNPSMRRKRLLACALQAVLAAAANALFTWQAKVAVEAEARRPIAQPMLTRGPYTDPVWTLPTLIRCSVITLVGGAIAGGTCWGSAYSWELLRQWRCSSAANNSIAAAIAGLLRVRKSGDRDRTHNAGPRQDAIRT